MMNEKRGKIKRTKEQEERGHELKNQSFKKSTFVHTQPAVAYFSCLDFIEFIHLMSFKNWPEGKNMD